MYVLLLNESTEVLAAVQMVEVCSPIVSSTSPPEMKSLGSGRTGQFPTRQHDHNNIGSIITMLIDEQVSPPSRCLLLKHLMLKIISALK